MNTFKVNLASVFLLLGILSCSEVPTNPSVQADIIGAWIESGTDSVYSIYQKSNGLDSNKMGWIFNTGGELIERYYGGWCATPPVFYANYEGTWNLESDRLIKIIVGYWGGIRNYSFKIVELTSTEMKIQYQYPQ